MRGLTRREDWFDWDRDDRTPTLRRMWDEGAPARQIMLAVGAPSRSSVIGKAHRLGLQSRPNPARPSLGPRAGSGIAMKEWWAKFWTDDKRDIVRRGYTRATAQPVSILANTVGCSMTSVMRVAKEMGLKHPGLRGNGMAQKKFKAEASSRVLRHPKTAPDGKALSLGELTTHDCRFPVTPHNARRHLFCGASTKGSPGYSSFCPFHHAIAYQPRNQMNEAA